MSTLQGTQNIQDYRIPSREKNKISDPQPQALIFSIQSHSVHDGPGTRTTVFFNGCPLRCIWCCNPEGLFNKPVLLHSNTKCTHCGECIKACPYNAITQENGECKFDRDICDKCYTMECVEACYHEGNSITGKYYTIPDLMRIFQRDRQFWASTGGVSFSGGEPLLQKNFILPLLKECKKSYIHTCIETTACVPSEYWMEVINYVDWIFVDIKHMNSTTHKQLTGADNTLILKNIRLLAEANWNGFIVPRIPIIPGKNDSEDNIRNTAKFIKDLDLEVINILPFHRLGESKYRQVGKNYQFAEQKPPEQDHMQKLKQIVEEEGLICFIGYNTPF